MRTLKNKTINNRNSLFIKNTTPKRNILLRKIINNNNSKTLNNLHNINKTLKHSFSPKINKYLVSFIKEKPTKFLLCNNNLLTINIGSVKKPKCLRYTSKKVKKFLLNNLKTSKYIDCNNIIPPKQYLSNCWFNTFFITFFISDKGRKFFKYFRQLMIEGKFANGTKISTNLSKAFFMLNIAIEAVSNNLLKKTAYQLNTNLLIKTIYDAINKKKMYDSNIRQVGEAGNPLDYYLTIFNYLNKNEIFMFSLPIYISADSKTIEKLLEAKNISIKPDIIVLEIYDNGINGPGYSGYIKDKEIKLDIFNTKYVLDSAIVRDTTGNHFCSLLTCNNNEFSFDGASFSKINPIKWKKLINTKTIWRFQGHDLKWSFLHGYQLLFYYRV